MNKPIKKIKTNPDLPKLKFGDIVQFDDRPPVKVVKFKDCELCCFADDCETDFALYCHNNCWTETGLEIMFKEIKAVKDE